MTANGSLIMPLQASTAWPGAPGLGAALGHGEALRHVLERLECIVDLNAKPGAKL